MFKNILEKIKTFHGHIGGYVVLGYKAGLAGVERLSEGNLHCIAYTGKNPPYSCMLDGIQIASKCTIGNNNLEVMELTKPIRIIFTAKNEYAQIQIKQKLQKKLEKLFHSEKFAKKLFDSRVEDLFEIYPPHRYPKICSNCVVIVISDTRTKKTDISGKYTIKYLQAMGHKVKSYEIVKNIESDIKNVFTKLLSNKDINVIITIGGTGISSKDITLKVIKNYIQDELVGFGELFRQLSYLQIGSAAILSRCFAAVIDKKLVVSLPGSLNAVQIGLDIIVPQISHVMKLLEI